MVILGEAEQIMSLAEQATGLSDWGGEALFEPEFRSMFKALRESAVNEAQLTPKGMAGAEQRLRLMAETRLRIIADRRKYPGIAEQKIVAPLIVLGFPRAGSSFLNSLLAQDPANYAPLSWQMLFPSPPPTPDTAKDDPRIALTTRMLEGVGCFTREMEDYHVGGAELPEECSFMMEHAAYSDNLSAFWKTPGYNKARGPRSVQAAYAMHRAVLQALQYGNPHTRFSLKFPGHIFHLEALLATYPDAMLIQTHRDPAKVMPSVTATIAAMRRQNSDLATDEFSIARGNNRGFAHGLAAAMKLRAENPAIDARFCDVHFRRLVADPVGTARMIYGHFGLTLSAEAEAAMAHWVEHGEDHRAKRKFTLAEFGLDEAGIEDNFATYIDHYGIERERPA